MQPIQKNIPSQFLKPWPLLNRLISLEIISYFDYVLAQQILRETSKESEGFAALICHLSLAVKQGHLCIKVEEGQLLPSIKSLWKNEENELNDLEFQELEKLIIKNFFLIPSEMITETHSNPLNTAVTTPLCRYHNHLYFQRYWIYETLFLQHFQNHFSSTPEVEINSKKVQEIIYDLLSQKKLLPEQAEAILQASSCPLAMICGGPGTGKTYTAGQLIKVLWQTMSEIQKANWEVALAAPTGKAAANLQKSLEKAIGNIEGFKRFTSSTLHSLLGIKMSGIKQKDISSKLSADLILVDESSMIDVRIMGYLFASIKPGARLVLLGDKYQLPPVAAGSIFSDLGDYLNQLPDKTHHPIELKVCLRAELKGIVDFAKAINQGKVEPSQIEQNFEGVSRIVFEYENQEIKKIQKALLEYATPLFPRNHSIENFQELFKQFNQFRLLSPLRQGPFGVDELNRLFFIETAKKQNKNYPLVIPIMLTNNHSRLELFNGECGLLIKHQWEEDNSHGLTSKEGDYALFPRANDELRRLPALLLPKYEFAYCLSVHKSQGSEFDHVLLLIPQGSEIFGKEVFYTAATRAKKKLTICGHDQVIQKTVETKTERLSGVTLRLVNQ